MKNEAEFNSVVSRSLNVSGYGFKIADTFANASYSRSPAPFDGFGVFIDKEGKGYPVYWESKYMKSPSSFNFNRLEDHQIESLLKFKQSIPNCLALFLICIDFGRGDKRVFYFKDLDDIYKRKQEKRNILKKEFIELKNYVTIKKGVIDFNEILDDKK